jgi:hypothetical protein
VEPAGALKVGVVEARKGRCLEEMLGRRGTVYE